MRHDFPKKKKREKSDMCNHILVAGNTGELKTLENPVQNMFCESFVSARPNAATCNRGGR